VPSTGSIRGIKKIWKSEPTIEGAGVHLKRAFGFHDPGQFDPFLLLDDFRSDNPADYLAGFPWHPHRGIETITYVLDGEVEHKDSLGHGGVISAGDIQWMTAGSGILHQEMPKGSRTGRMYGFQLWANLPASHKMMDPRYRDVRHDSVPVVKTPDGAEIGVIAGKVGEVMGPVQDIVTDPEYLDVSLKPGTQFRHPIAVDHTVFAYVVDGEGYFEPGREAFAPDAVSVNHFNMAVPSACPDGTLVLYAAGEIVQIFTAKHPVRFLLASGRPIGEPIAWHGPIVMNTRDELRRAFEELNSGTFIRHGGE
jgi:redox-sensitive bicupin YhaK (pirin superfamily)